MTKSPAFPYIYLPNMLPDKKLLMRTQPFYSIFYHTDTQTNNSIPQKLRQGMRQQNNRMADGKTRCRVNPSDYKYMIYKNLPFSINNPVGKTNLFFLMIVFVTTIILGTLAFSYWVYLLGDNRLDEDFKNVIQKRSLYLSILFWISVMILSIMFYEYFTLKFISLKWFVQYQRGTPEPSNFYDFLLNQRKIVLWVFLLMWIAVAMFITIVLSKRAEKFKQQIAINITLIIFLFISQYFYQATGSPLPLVFSVGIVATIIYLLSVD